MPTCCAQPFSKQRRSEPYRLVRRYFRQRQALDKWTRLAMAQTLAVTFRPGDRTATFYDKTLRPLGNSIAIVLCNGEQVYAPFLAGFRAQDNTDGSVSYGLQGNVDFRYRYDLPPCRGHGLDPWQNPSRFEAAVRLESDCLDALDNLDALPSVPELPRIMLGFPVDQPPEYVETPVLRCEAARSIGLSPQRLAQNPPELVERLLRQTWETQQRLPHTAENPTELLLIDAELCTSAHRPLRAWEDFGRLVGVRTWNPARAVRIFECANPAAEVLTEHGLDPRRSLDDQAVSGELLEHLEIRCRELLGDEAARFSQEDVYDALVAPEERILAVTEALPTLRARLTPYWSECTTDGDLRKVARQPQAALYSSGACRLQVVRRRDVAEPYYFDSAALGRRIVADWGSEYRSRSKDRGPTRTGVGV